MPDQPRALLEMVRVTKPGGRALVIAHGGNPISGMVVAELTEEQRTRLRQVLDGMLRERAGANGRAAPTNVVNIGIGTK